MLNAQGGGRHPTECVTVLRAGLGETLEARCSAMAAALAARDGEGRVGAGDDRRAQEMAQLLPRCAASPPRRATR